MFRYPALALSLLMIGMSFSSPKSQWLIDTKILNYAIQGNIYSWLFITCSFASLPLAIANFYIFIFDLTRFIEAPHIRSWINIIAFSLVPFIALYRFNYWVFKEIL